MPPLFGMLQLPQPENFQPLLGVAVSPAAFPFAYRALHVPDSMALVPVFMQSIGAPELPVPLTVPAPATATVKVKEPPAQAAGPVVGKLNLMFALQERGTLAGQGQRLEKADG